MVETNSYTSAIGSIRPVTLSFRPQTVPIYLWCHFLFGKYTLSIENITTPFRENEMIGDPEQGNDGHELNGEVSNAPTSQSSDSSGNPM